MTKYQLIGPKRFAHQQQGLKRLIDTQGKCALLMSAGTGKTMCAIDYLGLLGAASGSPEIRVLVVGPLACLDTWVMQASQYTTPQVNLWVEVLGGSILQRAESLAARGGSPYRKKLQKGSQRGKGSPPELRPGQNPTAINAHRSPALVARRAMQELPANAHRYGPQVLGSDKPRLVILVTNLDTFSRRDAFGSKTLADVLVESVKRFNPAVVICDEMHMIRSVASNTSMAMARIAKFVPRRIGLTGTVMPTGPGNVMPQWRFIDRYAFGWTDTHGVRQEATWSGFEERFIIKGGYMRKEVRGYQNLDEMQRIMAQNAIVVKKEDALDLPPTQDAMLPVMLSPAEQQAYSEMREDLQTKFEDGRLASVTSRLTQALRLRQITAGYLPDDEGHVQQIGTSKVDTIASLVHDTLIGEKRIVVFAYFSEEIKQLTRALTRRGTTVQVITGGTPIEKRMEYRHLFGSDDPQRIVMIAQISTMSLAVNELVTASNAVFASLSARRDELSQARDRLDRIGQSNAKVTFWYALAPGTIDEALWKAYKDRTSMEQAVLNHVQGYVTGEYQDE